MADDKVVRLAAWKERRSAGGHKQDSSEEVPKAAPSSSGGESESSSRVWELLIELEAKDGAPSDPSISNLHHCLRVERLLEGVPDIGAKLQMGMTQTEGYEAEEVHRWLKKATDAEVRRNPYFYKALVFRARRFIDASKKPL